MSGFLKRIKENKSSQTVRRGVQLLFLAIACLIGLRFIQFAGQLEKGIIPLVDRPPGVEAFLPISALISLKYFVLTGIINDIHPSGLVLFLIICATAFVIRKGFCAWVCPFGLLSEYLGKIHYRLFKRGVRLPSWLDRLLRTIKYFFAGFFIWSIFFNMPIEAVEEFIRSPYNILADIKMVQFFTQISMTAFLIIMGLILMSVLIRNFWCRYLCPYGAVLGVLSFLRPGKITFCRSCCLDCGACEKACPSLINIRQGETFFSFECNTCLQCVDVCPEKRALKYSFLGNRMRLGSIGIGMILVIMFTGGITVAKMTGHWENRISKKAYYFYMISQGMTDKPESGTRQYENQTMEKMLQMMKIMHDGCSSVFESGNKFIDKIRKMGFNKSLMAALLEINCSSCDKAFQQE